MPDDAMPRIELTQVDPCVGCGRCCDAIGLPPFEVPNPDLGPVPKSPFVPSDPRFSQWVRDTETFLAMPADLRAGHARMIDGLAGTPDGKGRPCAWFDAGAGRCRHYEWRPAVCRDFTPGEDRCNAVRFDPTGYMVWKGDVELDLWWNPRLPEREECHPRPDAVGGAVSDWPWDRDRDRVRWVDAAELAGYAAAALLAALAFG